MTGYKKVSIAGRKVLFRGVLFFLISIFFAVRIPIIVMASVVGPVYLNGNRNFKWPVPGYYNFTSCFFDKCAEHPKGDHYAIDIGANQGTVIVAAYDGVVVQHTNNGHADGGYGNSVLVRHDNVLMADGSTKTLYTRYSHMHSISVTDGQSVKSGVTQIGTVGGTGYGGTPYGSHLDFQVLDLPAPNYLGDRWSYSRDPFSNNLFENVVNNLQKYDTCQYADSYLAEIRKIYSSSSTVNPGISSLHSHNPVGYLDVAEGGEGKIHVAGWALDYDEPTTALEVHIYVGGAYGDSAIEGRAIKANKYRNDVPQALNNSSVGDYHGFDEWFDVGYTGTYPVYAYAINVGAKDSANCNTKLDQAPQMITIRSAVQTCAVPNISFTDIINGKRVNISANSGETVNYTIKKNGISIGNGTAYEAYSTLLSEEGNYEVSAYASKNGNNNSGVQVKNTSLSKVAAPSVSQSITGSGVVLNMESATPGATFYYTTSGNVPTVSSTQYSGAVIVSSEKTVKVLAVKAGYLNSDISETSVKLDVPPAPGGFKLDSEDKIPIGENISVSWDAETAAASYTVLLYKDNREISHTTTSGTNANLNLPNSGKYQIKIYATNFVGNSVLSDTVLNVEAMDPLKVRFEDWNGTLIKEQEVPYGKDATLPEDPSRRGYTFQSWINGEKIINVTENLTITAGYKINTYLVRFYDASMKQVGASQKVNYGASAVSPQDQLTDIPTGYVFAGWKVIDCASDSQCNYLEVDSDMKLQAVYYWENEDLPIVNEITSATWDSTTGNYTVKVKLTNYPTDITTALLRVSLFTSQGKMVKSTKTEFDVLADQSNEKEVTLKYNGTATVAKACVLGINGNDLTGSALSRESSKNITCLSGTVWSDWSEWSTTEPSVGDGQQVDQIVQYRYSDKAITASSSSSMPGWTLYNRTNRWSEYGSWSDWSENHRSASDSVQVEGRTIYRYYCFYCPVCGGREPYQGKSDCGRYTLTLANAQEYWSTIPFSQCNPQSYSYTSAKKWTTSLGDGQRWNLSTADIDHTDVGYQGDAGCPIIRYQTRYRTRNLIYTYYYYKWSDWSEWSETEVSANENRKVETRILYRTRDEVPVYDDLSGTEETGSSYTISGELKFKTPDLSGKLATVMVYKGKNADPNEDQIQYISQTTIGEGNTYSFTIIAKNDPTILSGDYTVCLGIEGATGLINVDMIEAPRASYSVVYVDDDGTEISAQTVTEGDNAVVPESPGKEGFLFTGWSSNAINVNENMTIVALYTPIQYVVAFVDSKNNTMTCDTYNYGDEIEVPADPSCEGCIFQGWDKIMDGITSVTENMIINAVYDVQKYTVVFVNENGEGISEQEVAHGNCAVPPMPLDVSGMEFKGWSTEKNWWSVTEDITVEPILAYAETTETPSYSIYEMEDSIAVFLETGTENADIYYSYQDSVLSINDVKYEEEPIIIPYSQMVYETTETATEYVWNMSAELNAYAVCEGKNDSGVQTITYQGEKSYHINQELTITLDVNGGDPLETSTMTVVEGELIGTLPMPTRSGYEFAGWFTEKNGGDQITEDGTIDVDCTIYAHWNEPHQHVNTEIRNAKEATTEEEGYTGDTYCIDCGELVSKGEIIPRLTIDENAPSITVTGGKGVTGKDITVSVDISRSTGIAGFSYDINYDETILSLKSVSAGELISGNGQISTNGNVVNWYTSDNVVGDGTLLNIVFTAASDAQAGSYPVSIALHDGKKNLVDENGTFIEANYISGQVKITTGMLGDLNGDEDITIADVVLLNRHVIGKTVISSDRLMYADLNGDEDITIGDVVLLNRHVLGKVNLFATEIMSLQESVFESQSTLGAAPFADSMKIYADDISMDAGTTVDIPVNLSGNTGLAGLALTVQIPDGYILNSIKPGTLLASGTFSTNGSSCTWYAADNITSNGVLMTLNVTASKTAESGQITIGVKDGKTNNLSDENGMTVIAAFGACNVTLNAEDKTECEMNGHKGGTATCVSKAICEVCREAYGEINAENHTGSTEIRGAIEATVEEPGYTGDIYCKDCGVKLQDGNVIPRLQIVKISAENVVVRAGEQISVPVQISGNSGIAGLALTVAVPDGIVLDGIEKGSVLSTGSFSVSGNYCTWYAADNLSSDGLLMTLKLTVGENCTGGEIAIGLKDGKANNLSDENGQSVAVSFQAGTVTMDTRTECEINGHTGGTATCSEKAICSVCGEYYGETNQGNHTGQTLKRNQKDATCTENGYTGDIICSDCGGIIQQGAVTEALGHKWDSGLEIQPATCIENGIKTITCTVCHETKTEDIPATGHQRTELRSAKKATCSSEGYTGDIFCQDCGNLVEEGKVIAKLEHAWDAGKVTVKATCTSEGTKTFKCTVCGSEKAEVIPAAGHGKTEVRNVREVSCSLEGYTGDIYCTDCNQLISSGSVIAKKDHSWDSGRVIVQPTTTSVGTRIFTCQKCGTTRTEPIAKLQQKGLTPGKVVKDKATNGVYKVLKDGFSVEFTKPVSKKASIRVPDTIKVKGITCKVTGISANAFKNNVSLKTVTIGKNVTTIGTGAFYGCKKLNKVSGGTRIEKIGDKAFSNCSSLSSITISGTVKSIGKQAFYNCKKLKKITVKTSMLTSKTIGSKAFTGTYSKPTVKVPAKKLKEYKKLLKSKGMSKKAVYKK